MDEEYDVIVLGTGLTECILSGLLSVDGKKVLHMDRNEYYGGETTSFDLLALYRNFRGIKEVDELPADLKAMGRPNTWAIDLVPKFIIASGELTQMLAKTKVTQYLEFKQIAGSYVYRDGKISKVPSNEMEALKSPLMGLFEKRRAKGFFEFLQNWKDDDPTTHQGLDLDKDSMKKVYEYFKLEPGTQDFIGHAMALQLDDSYIHKPARPTYEAIVLYTKSMARWGKSPYIYPLYGLGELPQSFSRLSAVYGGTYMLRKEVDEIITDPKTGMFVGVRSGEEVAKAKMVIGDPSYFGGGDTSKGTSGKVRVVKLGNVVRAICFLKGPIFDTEGADSVQIIIPQNQIGRKNDIYIASVSSTHNVCPKGVHIAIISSISESKSDKPSETEIATELSKGLELVGKLVKTPGSEAEKFANIREKFLTSSPLYVPTSDGKNDGIYVTKSYDATSHFETVVEDVNDVWKRIHGIDLVLKNLEEVNVEA